MGLISTTIPNLANGISQQPYALRLASQAQEQINGYSSVVEGLGKRPGTRHVARLGTGLTNAYLHTINRDKNEKYLIVVQSGKVRVFDLQGVEKTVHYPYGEAYLWTNNPAEDFQCITVADYTFILNKTKVVEKNPAVANDRPQEALVWIKQGAYGATYKLYIDGTQVASYTTPDGSLSEHASQVTTDHIAEQIRSQFSANTDFWCGRVGSTLHIHRKDSANFSVGTDDSIGDNGIGTIKGKVQRFSELPARAVNGFRVEVSGDQSSSFDNYYVRYTTDGGTGGDRGGIWQESIKQGDSQAFLWETLPHALIRRADGSFEFRRLDWKHRKVGDLDSNPFPSFVGRKINDIFFHRNRLGFISDENICFSKSGEYFDFFRGTATAVLDDDPIDIGVSHTKVSILRHAIPFNETLLLFSDKTQFQLGVADILTPETVSVNQTTEYECSLRAKPVGAGRYVYFSVNRGTFTGLREYYVDGQTESEEAAEITGHIPKYIPGGVFKIAACGNEDLIAVLSDQAPNEIFTYRYYLNGGEKLQSAWSRWQFAPGDKILNVDFIESDMFVLVERTDGLHLEVMHLQPGAVENNWEIPVHLDSMVTSDQVFHIFHDGGNTIEGDDTTHIRLPYKLPTGAKVQVVTGPGGSRPPGVIREATDIDSETGNTVLVLKGNWMNQPFYIGKPYEFRYRFSTFVIKEESIGGGQMTIGEGRIQLRKVTLLYNRTGYFRTEVTPFRRETYAYIFSGRVVGSGKNLLGQVPIEQGKFSFPIAAKNDQVTVELVNDSYLPCYFLSAEWEAFYTIRSRRL